MAGVGDAAERCFDVVPAPLVVEPAPDQLSDECAALSRAGTPVEFSHEFVVQNDVQQHGPNLAHTGVALPERRIAGEAPAVGGWPPRFGEARISPQSV